MEILKKAGIGEDICIDPGSDFISVYISGKGIVLREAAAVAYNKKTHEIIAAGDEAAETEGKTPETVEVKRPIKGGVVTDEELAGELFSRLLSKVKRNGLVKPRIMVSIPCGISDVEERALIRAVMRAGARQVFTVEAPVVSALGAGCDVTIARGLMILDIGGEKTDIAVVSLCRCVEKRTVKTAGSVFSDEVIKFMKKRYSLKIGRKTADFLKENICGFSNAEKTAEVYGMDISTHMPRKVCVNSSEIIGIFDACAENIAVLIKDTLNSVPSEFLGDIMEDGILAVGGGMKFLGLAEKLSVACGIKIFPADESSLCNIKGLKIAMENLNALPGMIIRDKQLLS